MISFAEFLDEQMFQKHGSDYVHLANIHGHHVHLGFYGNDGTYEVAYLVNHNHTISGSHVEPEHRAKILHHVNRVINHFIVNHKPKSVFFSTVDSRAERTYEQLGKRLAKKYGGKYEHDIFHMVHFKR